MSNSPLQKADSVSHRASCQNRQDHRKEHDQKLHVPVLFAERRLHNDYVYRKPHKESQNVYKYIQEFHIVLSYLIKPCLLEYHPQKSVRNNTHNDGGHDDSYEFTHHSLFDVKFQK